MFGTFLLVFAEVTLFPVAEGLLAVALFALIPDAIVAPTKDFAPTALLDEAKESLRAFFTSSTFSATNNGVNFLRKHLE